MYDKTTEISNVSDCRRILFMKKSKTVENILPTRNALIEHIKRAVYQAGWDSYKYALIHFVLYDKFDSLSSKLKVNHWIHIACIYTLMCKC